MKSPDILRAFFFFFSGGEEGEGVEAKTWASEIAPGVPQS